jgi:hypothetical protein
MEEGGVAPNSFDVTPYGNCWSREQGSRPQKQRLRGERA